MGDLFSYLDWRGDLTFKEDKLNEIDCLLFSVLAYLPFEKVWDVQTSKNAGTSKRKSEIKNKSKNNCQLSMIQGRRKMLLRNLVDEYFEKAENPDEQIGKLIPIESNRLAKEMAKTNRFAKLTISDIETNNKTAGQEQFAAMTIHLNDRNRLIVFRGTDDTLIGWKEDFNMSLEKPVLSQIEASCYLQRIAKKYKGPLYLTGHSKGGNLALYAAMTAENRLQKRISFVTNNDGPGFAKSILTTKLDENIAGKIKSFIPQNSIVGMLLEHKEQHIIVKSNEKWLMQHNPFSWEICGKQFVLADELTQTSVLFDISLKELTQQMEEERKKVFIDAVYELLTQNEYTLLSQLNWKSLSGILRTYNKMDEQKKHVISETISAFLKIIIKQMQACKKETKQ